MTASTADRPYRHDSSYAASIKPGEFASSLGDDELRSSAVASFADATIVNFVPILALRHATDTARHRSLHR